jgi:hypothetical protein
MMVDTGSAIERPSGHARRHRIVRTIARIIVTLAASFWSWFAASVAASEGPASLGPSVAIIAPLALITALAWIRPAIGGVLAIIGGLVAAWIFPHPAPQLLMALPLVASGLALVWTGFGRSGRSTPSV